MMRVVTLVRHPGVQLQLALAAVAILAALTLGGPTGAVVVACAAAGCWVVAALVQDMVPEWVNLVLFAAMLLGSAATAVPTSGVAIEPMVASIVVVVGDVVQPRWTRWAWPVAGVVACATGYAFYPSPGAGVTVGIVLVVALIASSSRRATRQASRGQLQHLERKHIAELERLRIAAERALTPQRLLDQFPMLTAREAEVLSFIAHGDSNEEIAAQLFVSIATVKSHINALFTKMPARDRAQAIALVLGTARSTSETR